jgi:hypothetical protein
MMMKISLNCSFSDCDLMSLNNTAHSRMKCQFKDSKYALPPQYLHNQMLFYRVSGSL